jgi:HEPN domain-containing protein
MNRSDLQKLAQLRVEDATVLLRARRWAGAYYLAGYAVECALKACIAKQVKEFDFPDKEIVKNSYVHDLTKLLNLSGVGHLHEQELKKNDAFNDFWAVIKDWNETSRYADTQEKIAQDMVKAVTDAKDGVLKWLMNHW